MPNCIHFSSFDAKYPREQDYFSKGADGKVYKSLDGMYAIKEQKISHHSITEICILSQFSHPNICPILDICFDNRKVYFALPLGRKLSEVYLENQQNPEMGLSLRDIVTDIVSGVAFLHSNGVSHCDLKAANCIVYENRVKIIDFGFSKVCEKYNIGEKETFLWRGEAYTNCFDDPEYDSMDFSCIESENYSISSTIYNLVTNEYRQGSERIYYRGPEDWLRILPNISDEMIDLFLELEKPLVERKNIKDLMNHPALDQDRISRGIVRTFRQYKVSDILRKTELTTENFLVLFDWLIGIDQMHLKELFATFDLIYRYFNEVEEGVADINKFQLVGLVAMYISRCVFDRSMELSTIVALCQGKYTTDEITEMICSFCTVLRGKFYYNTPHDFVKFEQDILPLLRIMSNPDYISDTNFEIPIGTKIIDRNKYPGNFFRNMYKELKEFDESGNKIKRYRELYRRIPLLPFIPSDKNNYYMPYIDLNILGDIIERIKGAFFKSSDDDNVSYYDRIIRYVSRYRNILGKCANQNTIYEKLYTNYIQSKSSFFLKSLVNMEKLYNPINFSALDTDIFNKNVLTVKREIIDEFVEENKEARWTAEQLLVNLEKLHTFLLSGAKKYSFGYTEGMFKKNMKINAKSKARAIINFLNKLRENNPKVWDIEAENISSKEDFMEWYSHF